MSVFSCWEIFLANILQETSAFTRNVFLKEFKQQEKGTTEDEMVIWHHRLDGHEFEQALGVGDGWMDGGAGMLLSMWSQRVGHD